jgi:DNA-binding SARP family transcriptional activator
VRAITSTIATAIATVGRLASGLVKAAALLALLGGVPAGLLTQIPWPSLTQTRRALHDPLSALTHALTGGLSDTTVIVGLAVVLWILWAAFTLSVVVELGAAIRGVPVPHYRLLGPTQTLAGWLLAGVLAVSPAMGTVAHATLPATAAASTAVASSTPVAGATDVTVRPAFAVTTARAGPSTTVVSWAGASRAPAAAGPVYRVEHGDWMVIVAERFLGDQDRYPEIAALNPRYEHLDHRFPDHWEPGWTIVLPDDAHDRGPRRHATGHLVVTAPAAPTQPGADNGGRRPPGPPTPPAAPGPSRSAKPAGPSAPASPGPSAAPSAPASDQDGVVVEPSGQPSTPAPAVTRHAPASPNTDLPAVHTPGRGVGVELPGGWVTLPLAAALIAAAAMVWLQRRRRYIPRPPSPELRLDDPDLRALPPVVTRLRRAVRQDAPHLLRPPSPRQPTVAEYTRNADAGASGGEDLELPPIGPSGVDLAGLAGRVPAGGLGLTGPGADAAGRALLVATLSAGGPHDPDARSQVVIAAAALTTLLGAQAVAIGPMPRLVVTATLSEALTHIEELLIERRRLLEEYETNDLVGMRTADPYHPPMPPVLLLAETPPAELRARLTTTLHLGTPLQISAVLLGEWPRGETLTVQHDGHTTGGDTQRLAVLDLDTTLQLLQVLCEAHTGQPANAALVDTTPTDIAAPAPLAARAETLEPASTAAPADGDCDGGEPASARTDQTADPAPTQPAATAADPTDNGGAGPVTAESPPSPGDLETADVARRARRRPVRIQLLGAPTIIDRDGKPVPGLRHHARELLVYLAVHRGGADLSDIMEAFWPTATVRRAGERLSTETGDLRRRLRQAAGDPNVQPVVNTGGHYHLDPNLLDIDIWDLLDALRQAAASTEPAARIAALHRVVDAHTGTLAEGHDYDWIEQPREQLRRHGIRARLQLADLLADTHPRRAADLAGNAADLDPYNEDLARRAMEASARLGDAAAVRTRLHRLRDALDEIDEEPSADTLALAAQLHRETSGTGSRPHCDGPDHTPPADA